MEAAEDGVGLAAAIRWRFLIAVRPLPAERFSRSNLAPNVAVVGNGLVLRRSGPLPRSTLSSSC